MPGSGLNNLLVEKRDNFPKLTRLAAFCLEVEHADPDSQQYKPDPGPGNSTIHAWPWGKRGGLLTIALVHIGKALTALERKTGGKPCW
jgi:hypothetical protein